MSTDAPGSSDQRPQTPGQRSGQTVRHTSLIVIFLVLFTDLVGFGIVFPLLAEMLDHYLRNDQGLLRWAMAGVDSVFPEAGPNQRAALFGGLIGAVYAGLQFIAAPFWGRLSDRIGRRPVLMVSLSGSLGAALLWVFSGDFTLLLVSRLIAGAMSGNVAVATAAVADITTPQTRARAMGVIGMAFGLGFILGPAIGGLSYWFAREHLPGVFAATAFGLNPFSVPAAIAAVLAAINLAWAVLRFRETLPPDQRGVPATHVRTANPLRLFTTDLGPGVATTNLAFMLHTLLFAGMEATLVFLAAEFLGFRPEHNAWLFVWMGFMSALVQGGIYRRLVARADLRWLAVAGLLLLAPGFALIALVTGHPSTALLVVGVTVLSFGTGLVFPSLSAMASLAGDRTNQGAIMGTFRSAGALGRALGPLLAALIYFGIAPSAPYWLGAIGILIPVILVWRLAPVRYEAQTVAG